MLLNLEFEGLTLNRELTCVLFIFSRFGINEGLTFLF